MKGLNTGPSGTGSLRRILMTFGAAALGLCAWAAVKTGAAQDAAAGAAAPAAPAYEKRWEDHPFVDRPGGSCFNCHETISGKWGRPARLHLTSAHYRAGITCQDCHGGDATKQEEKEAHDLAKGWVAGTKFDLAAMNERCGKCHQKEVETFNESSHIHDYEDVRKLDCSTCHTAHQVGAPTRSMSWSATCQECHSLEDVPDLPKELASMIASKDQLHTKLRKLRFKLFNQPFPAEVMEPFRDVRQRSADVVHATKTKQIAPVTNYVIEGDAKLAALIESQLAK